MNYFTNEDYADYVVCISILYQKRQIKVTHDELIEIINFYYYKFCAIHHLIPQELLPIRAITEMNLPQR